MLDLEGVVGTRSVCVHLRARYHENEQRDFWHRRGAVVSERVGFGIARDSGQARLSGVQFLPGLNVFGPRFMAGDKSI